MKKGRLIDETLLTLDEGRTSDEHIQRLSVAKEQISTDFINAMKQGAVDCVLNAGENEPVQCFLQEGSQTEFL